MATQPFSLDAIRSVPLFTNLSDEMLESVVKASTVVTFRRNQTIVREKEEGNALFIILSGRVKVTLIRSDGKEAILAILRANDFFGEMALLDDQPRSASVVALESTRALMLTRPNFIKLLEDDPQIVHNIMVALSGRLRKANQKIADLAFLDAIGRICGVILQMAEEAGEETDEGILIHNRPSHEQLGMMAGTTRETATHCMIALERRGYLLTQGRDLLLFSPEDLKRDFLSPSS